MFPKVNSTINGNFKPMVANQPCAITFQTQSFRPLNILGIVFIFTKRRFGEAVNLVIGCTLFKISH